MEDLFAEEFDLEQMEAETEAMLALNYLDRSNSTFHRTEGGFVSLDTQEKHYNRVQVFRTFPFTGKNMYISIREPDVFIRSLQESLLNSSPGKALVHRGQGKGEKVRAGQNQHMPGCKVYFLEVVFKCDNNVKSYLRCCI